MILSKTEKAIAVLIYCKENNLKLFIEPDETENKTLLSVEYPIHNNKSICNFISTLDNRTDLESIFNEFYDCFMEVKQSE